MTAITEYTLGNFDANYAAVEVPDTDGVRLVLSHPAADENLWEEYLCGAWEAYERYGAQAALDVPAVRDGISTSLFYALVDDGAVVGGVRAQGPTSALLSHMLWSNGRATGVSTLYVRRSLPESPTGWWR